MNLRVSKIKSWLLPWISYPNPSFPYQETENQRGLATAEALMCSAEWSMLTTGQYHKEKSE